MSSSYDPVARLNWIGFFEYAVNKGSLMLFLVRQRTLANFCLVEDLFSTRHVASGSRVAALCGRDGLRCTATFASREAKTESKTCGRRGSPLIA